MKHHTFVRLPTTFDRVLRIMSVLLIFGLCLTAATRAVAQSGEITLLHIGDTHSHLAAWGPKDAMGDGTLGGLPKVAAIVAAEKSSDPQALFVHAGDFMEGDLFFKHFYGVPELTLLKSMGLDALVLGNHDFVFGPGFLAYVLQTAYATPANGVPILGSNLVVPSESSLAPWITPTLIKEVHGVKVGLFGLTVRKAARENSDPVVILKYPDPSVPPVVAALRAAGAQVVICVAHVGLDAARNIATSVPGIDLIVTGHDHAVLEQPEKVGSTLIVSAGSNYRWVGRLRLSVDGSQVSLVDYTLLGADADTPPLPAARTAINELKEEINKRDGDMYYQPFNWAETDLTADLSLDSSKRSTALGNLLTDAYRARTGTDIAIEAMGWMGDTVPAGPVVGADIFRAMSYTEFLSEDQPTRPWQLVTLRASGAALLGVFEFTLHAGGDYFPQVSGLSMDYDSSSLEKWILEDSVHVGGNRIVKEKLYSVTVTEGTLAGLETIGKIIGIEIWDVQHLSDSAFDAIKSYVAQVDDLGLGNPNRIRDVAGKDN